MEKNRKAQINKLTLGAIMTALVIISQLLATFFPALFGPFAAAVALVPIVIGGALCGVSVGTWLGFVFGVVVLLSGGASFFMAVDIPGTIITVLLKGALCGFAAALTYKLVGKLNKIAATFASALVCPVVNTGIFLLGCFVFFMDDIENFGDPSLGFAIFWGMAMVNFIFEILLNIVLAPVVIRIINLRK